MDEMEEEYFHGSGKWKYAFDCRNCSHVKYIKDGIRDGYYCVPGITGSQGMHADDDYVVRCDSWAPAQVSLFGMEG